MSVVQAARAACELHASASVGTRERHGSACEHRWLDRNDYESGVCLSIPLAFRNAAHMNSGVVHRRNAACGGAVGGGVEGVRSGRCARSRAAGILCAPSADHACVIFTAFVLIAVSVVAAACLATCGLRSIRCRRRRRSPQKLSPPGSALPPTRTPQIDTAHARHRLSMFA